VFRRGVAAAFASGCACALTACSLLLGEGFTDPESGTSGDSSADATSAADGSTTDTNANDASGNDGRADADAGAAGDGSCPSAAVSFCDDFNRTDVKGDWPTMQLTTGGALSLVPGDPSGKRLETGISALGAHAYLLRKTSFVPTKFHMAASIDFGTLPQAGAVYMFGVSMWPTAGTAPSLAYVYAESSGIYFVQQITDGTGYQRDAIPIASDGNEHRIVMDVVLGGQAVVTVDGNAVVNRATAGFLVADPIECALGADSIDGTGNGFTFHADDFVFTAD
jgi:hypothetical protein